MSRNGLARQKKEEIIMAHTYWAGEREKRKESHRKHSMVLCVTHTHYLNQMNVENCTKIFRIFSFALLAT